MTFTIAAVFDDPTSTVISPTPPFSFFFPCSQPELFFIHSFTQSTCTLISNFLGNCSTCRWELDHSKKLYYIFGSGNIAFSENSNYWREGLLEVKRQNIAGLCQQTFFFKSLLTRPINVLPLRLKQTFPSIIWIFTEGEGDEIQSRLRFKIFFILMITIWLNLI